MSITQKDIKLLWGRAGSRCAICRIELSHDAAQPCNSYVLGEQAHIVGETSGAARGKSNLSLDDRNSYHNLILLCPTHHTEIDKSDSDWPLEELYQVKSKHELWVRESLGSSGNLQAKADELVVSSSVDCIVQSLNLENWTIWTSYALGPDPTWPNGMDAEIYRCLKKMMAAIWPAEYDELRRAAITLAGYTHKASETFFEHAEQRGDEWRAVRFYKTGGWNPNYDADVESFRSWVLKCYNLIHLATKAANWFADVVRRDVNPLFFAEKGRFMIEEGMFIDGSYTSSILQFTDFEKSSLPDSLLDESSAEPAET